MKFHTCKTYCISSLRIRDITICEIHYWRRSMQCNLVGWVNPMFITINNMWVWWKLQLIFIRNKYHQYAHICLNSMILPYRQLTMDNFRIINYSCIKHANIEHSSINEDDNTRYIHSLYNTTAYSSIIQILKIDMYKTSYRSESDVSTMINFVVQDNK